MALRATRTNSGHLVSPRGTRPQEKSVFKAKLASQALILLGTSNRHFDSQRLLWHYVPHVRIAAILYRLGVQDLRKKSVFKAKLSSQALILLGTSNRHFDSQRLLWHYVPHVRIAAILYHHVCFFLVLFFSVFGGSL